MKALLAALALVITLLIFRPGRTHRDTVPEEGSDRPLIAAVTNPTAPTEQPPPRTWSENRQERDAHLRERLATLTAHRPGCKCPEHR